MQQLLVMMQKISAEPDNNAMAESDANRDTESDANRGTESDANRDTESDANLYIRSSEINVGSYRPSAAREPSPSDAHTQSESGVAPPEKPFSHSTEHQPVDQIGKQSEDQLIAPTTVGSVSDLVVQSQQVEVDETPISTVTASSCSIQSVDAESDEHDAGLSVPLSEKPLTGKAGFIKRWFSKAVSWIKRLVGF